MSADRALPAAANDDEPEPRERHDGFTAARRRRCLELIGNGHCIAEACYRVGVSTTSFYRHKRKFAAFRRAVETAEARAELPLENTAWERAVVGAEERIYRGGKLVQVRIKPSDAMLRLLLQGRYPNKYGFPSRGGESKKQIEKRLRKEIRRELTAELTPREANLDEVCRALAKRLKKQFGPEEQREAEPRPELGEEPEWDAETG
ncbi:MAG TPA: hypothetical protein VN231_05830 [Allosphingosinicella sp.]|nr:hypothetical protein [Allosphingosinicella sp.]